MGILWVIVCDLIFIRTQAVWLLNAGCNQKAGNVATILSQCIQLRWWVHCDLTGHVVHVLHLSS